MLHTLSLCDSHAVVHRPNGALTSYTVVVLKPQMSMFVFMNKIVLCSYIHLFFTVDLNTCIGSFTPDVHQKGKNNM